MKMKLVRALWQGFISPNKTGRTRNGLPVKTTYCETLRTSSSAVQENFLRPVQRASKVSSLPEVSDIIAADESLRSADYFQVHNLFTVKDLFDARVHLGHKIGSLDRNMRPFVFGSRFDSVIFDLDLTAHYLRQALNFTAHIAFRKGIILFITRAPNTMNLVERTAIECGEYAHTKEWETKVFTDSVRKFGGITRLPDLLIFMNTLTTILSTNIGVKDAAKMLIPSVGIVDSNCNPNLITYPVPGNDDTLSAVELYCKLFKEAILRGKNKRKLWESQQEVDLAK